MDDLNTSQNVVAFHLYTKMHHV